MVKSEIKGQGCSSLFPPVMWAMHVSSLGLMSGGLMLACHFAEVFVMSATELVVVLPVRKQSIFRL